LLLGYRIVKVGRKIFKGTSKNPNLCVTLLQQNAHLRQVNSAFVSVASLDIEIFRSSLNKKTNKTFEGIYGA
jgi:hypothetical protein